MMVKRSADVGRVQRGEFLDDIPKSGEPSPELVVGFLDEIQHLFDVLDDDKLRRVASLKMEDRSNEQIAEVMGVSKKTVDRKLTLMRSSGRTKSSNPVPTGVAEGNKAWGLHGEATGPSASANLFTNR